MISSSAECSLSTVAMVSAFCAIAGTAMHQASNQTIAACSNAFVTDRIVRRITSAGKRRKERRAL
jgi:hypothetical protein